MSEFGQEFRTDTEVLESIDASLNSLLDVMVQFGGGDLGGGVGGGGGEGGSIDQATGQFMPQKEQGEMSKALGKFTKTLKKAPATFVLERLMSLIEPLMSLFEPFIVLFDIFGSLLSVFAGEIMKSLFDAMQPVFDILIGLTPLFKIIGQLVGSLIKVALIPLQIIFEVIGAVLKPFIPLLEKLTPIIELVASAIGVLIRFAMIPLIGAVYAIGLAIAALINFFTFGLVDAISGWNGIMLPVLSSIATPLAGGGIVTGPGLFTLGDNRRKKEAVVPLEKAGQMGFGGGESEFILMDIRDSVQESTKIQRRQGRGIQRGRFGR